ncbi:MAG: glycosyltransferase [Acidobacteria bacterium]|nr:glycosyltransferase [Acidobacteriota bacterium]
MEGFAEVSCEKRRSGPNFVTLGNRLARSMSDAPTLSYSVVIPVHNEEADVQELARRTLEQLGPSCELIFVDDGSTDATWQRLLEIAEPDRVRLIRFRRNFGKAAALMAGFAVTRGGIVFTLDGDLQDDPAEIPRFLEQMTKGYGLVTGYKKKRHDPVTKVIASRIFNFVVRKLTKLDLHDMNCGFKCFQGDLARRLRIRGELHRFIPAMVAAEGYAVGEIEVRHQARKHGRSKYGASRLFKGFVDLITVMLLTEYRQRPAHGFGWAALACLALSALTGLLAAGLRAGGLEPHWGASYFPLGLMGWALGLKALFFGLTAVVLLAAGWVAEIVITRPLELDPSAQYVVEDRLD